MQNPLVQIAPEIMSGTPCFAGTRVPIRTLTDFLADGESIDDFLEGFPSVSREQAVAFIRQSAERMTSAAVVDRERAA